MESLPRELRLKVLDHCDLETLLSLAQVSKSLQTILSDFEDNLIKDMVLQRAPWFQLNPDIKTWTKRARVLVARTRAVLKSKDPENDWFIVDDLKSAMKLEPDTTLVDPDNFPKMDKNSKFIFANEVLDAPGGHTRGSKMLVRGHEVDLLTRITGPTDFDPDEIEDYGVYPYSKSEVVTPSGLKMRSHDGTRVQVMAENDKLLLIRVQTCPDSDIEEYSDEDDDNDPDGGCFSWMLDDDEHVVYKDTCPREDGVLVINREKLITVDTPRHKGMSFFKLLPGSGGALVSKLYADKPSYLAYIEPAEDLRHVVICFLPSLRQPQSIEYDWAKPKNYILYRGFLFYLYEGRVFRLWVDLGVEKLVGRGKVQEHTNLPQKFDTQCLTAYHPGYKPLGTFAEQNIMYSAHALVQGSKKAGLNHFVTIRKAAGYVVANLKTGKTYQVNEFSPHLQMVMPYLADNQVRFFSMDHQLAKFFFDKLHDLYPNRHEKFDWNGVWKTVITNRAVTHPEKRIHVPRKLHYNYEGKATIATFGPYLKGDEFNDATYGSPNEYMKKHLVRQNWEDLFVDDGYVEDTSEEAYLEEWDAYHEGMDDNIRTYHVHKAEEEWDEIFEEICLKAGNLNTNDPHDPKNKNAKRMFAQGLRDGLKHKCFIRRDEEEMFELAKDQAWARGFVTGLKSSIQEPLDTEMEWYLKRHPIPE